MGGIVDDICDGSVDPARSAECLASSGFGRGAHSAGELFHCLVPILHHQTRQNGTASLKGARGGGNLLGRSADFRCKIAQLCATGYQSERAKTPSVRNDAQACESTRKKSFLNYESPALTAELQALRADPRTSNIQRSTSNDWAASFANHHICHSERSEAATQRAQSARPGFQSQFNSARSGTKKQTRHV